MDRARTAIPKIVFLYLALVAIHTGARNEDIMSML